jgi:hypothetical protein
MKGKTGGEKRAGWRRKDGKEEQTLGFAALGKGDKRGRGSRWCGVRWWCAVTKQGALTLLSCVEDDKGGGYSLEGVRPGGEVDWTGVGSCGLLRVGPGRRREGKERGEWARERERGPGGKRRADFILNFFSFFCFYLTK